MVEVSTSQRKPNSSLLLSYFSPRCTYRFWPPMCAIGACLPRSGTFEWLSTWFPPSFQVWMQRLGLEPSGRNNRTPPSRQWMPHIAPGLFRTPLPLTWHTEDPRSKCSICCSRSTASYIPMARVGDPHFWRDIFLKWRNHCQDWEWGRGAASLRNTMTSWDVDNFALSLLWCAWRDWRQRFRDQHWRGRN